MISPTDMNPMNIFRGVERLRRGGRGGGVVAVAEDAWDVAGAVAEGVVAGAGAEFAGVVVGAEGVAKDGIR